MNVNRYFSSRLPTDIVADQLATNLNDEIVRGLCLIKLYATDFVFGINENFFWKDSYFFPVCYSFIDRYHIFVLYLFRLKKT